MTPQEVKLQKINVLEQNEDWTDSDEEGHEKNKTQGTDKDKDSDSLDDERDEVIKLMGNKVFLSNSQNIELSRKWIDVFIPLLTT